MDNIRKQIIAKLKAQAPTTVAAHSQKICEVLYPLIKTGMRIGFYMAMDYEVQLDPLRKQLRKHVQCAVPKIEKHGIMSFYYVDETTIWERNPLGIEEPLNAKLAQPMDFDIILVPMVYFDEQKHRLGHGAGYYDRYLINCHALKIGVAFELQKGKAIEVRPHDVDMDMIITEAKIYQ